MEHLRQSDLRAVLDFVSDCYAIREPESFERFVDHLVTTLPQLIRAEHVTYNEMDPQKSKSYNYVNTPELATPEAAILWEQHMHEHPVLAHVVRTSDCRAVKISDFWCQRQLRDRGLYNDFYRGLGIEDALCANLSYQPPHIVGIGLHRGRRFSERERLVLDLVRPHTLQAWQNAKLVSRTQRELQLLTQGVENIGSGVIVCGPKGRIQLVTGVARRYLAEYFGLHALGRSLPDELLRWVQHQNAQLLKSDVPPVRLPLVKEKGNKRLVIRLLSDRGANLLLLEEESPTLNASAIERLGLTRRETEVLLWVAQGKSNSEIATILGMTTGTVKKHMEHIFNKLGVETRTAAAALALQIGSAATSISPLEHSQISTSLLKD